MDATDTIANWIVNTTYEDISPGAIRVANESCFDVIGVILAGSAQPAGEIIKKYVAYQGAAPQATVLSTGEQSSVANAVFANGTMGHALDFDDFGGFGHPTVAIFPALLAIGRLACTAACAKLMKLDHDQTVMALGMAGSMASD